MMNLGLRVQVAALLGLSLCSLWVACRYGTWVTQGATAGVWLSLGWLWCSFAFRPIETLRQRFNRITVGEMGIEVPLSGAKETRLLAEAFNALSRSLAEKEQALDTKNVQLIQYEKLSAIGELSAGLAHEVKNPMVGIVGFSQLGVDSSSLDEAKDYFKLIEADAQRANGILQNLLDFARPPDSTMETVDINPIVQGAVRLCLHQLQIQGVNIDTKYGEGLPAIRGNSNQLRQVVLNLIMNAGQAVEGTPVPKISVSTARKDKLIEIVVRDNGTGISDEVRHKLFEPFFSTKPRGKGTGLGLSVSKSIVVAHQGEILVDSELGQGAKFVLRLPTIS